MTGSINPAWILILGALAVPVLKGRWRAGYMLALPLLGIVQLLVLPYGSGGELAMLGFQLTTLRLDRLSFVFALIFFIGSWLGIVYALHLKDTLQQVAALVYAGAAIGAVLAGDLVTLFVYWELTAVSSAFLVWAGRSPRAYRAGMRYVIIHAGSGVLLLAGIILRVHDTGSVAFDHIGIPGAGGGLILLAFGIKCAFPLLHNWLQDAYPESTVTGTVVLSVFSTKLAVYALARGFPGTELLIYVGAVMTVFPIFFAVIENDLRRVLSYSLNNQLGFMVVGVGIGTELSLNGTAAHAFSHILYKSLLFMSMGAVLYRAGTVKASELGGLYKSMPWTAALCMVGSLSIAAFPLFSGFVSKSMILAGVAEQNYWVVWLVLLLASAGVMDHSGIKIPFFSFFAHDSGIRVREAPPHMLAAMGLTAFACLFIGVFPGALYALLPYPVEFDPYTASHVITQTQLLLFSALAFTVLYRSGLYPPEIPSINLDFDWVYRRIAPLAVGAVLRWLIGLRSAAGELMQLPRQQLARLADTWTGARGIINRMRNIDVGVAVVVALLGLILLYSWLLI